VRFLESSVTLTFFIILQSVWLVALHANDASIGEQCIGLRNIQKIAIEKYELKLG
jgi:hypothetical protein